MQKLRLLVLASVILGALAVTLLVGDFGETAVLAFWNLEWEAPKGLIVVVFVLAGAGVFYARRLVGNAIRTRTGVPIVMVALLVAAFVLLVVSNSDESRFSVFFKEVEAPTWSLFVLSMLVGAGLVAAITESVRVSRGPLGVQPAPVSSTGQPSLAPGGSDHMQDDPSVRANPPGGVAPPSPPALPSVRTSDERKAMLGRAIATNLAQPGKRRVESQTDFYAVIVKGKQINHVLHLLLTLFTIGIWVIVWIIMAASGGETRYMISVDEYGNVSTSRL